MTTETKQFSSETLACLMRIIKALPPHGGFAEPPPARHRLLSMFLTSFDHKNDVFHKKNGATAGGGL